MTLGGGVGVMRSRAAGGVSIFILSFLFFSTVCSQFSRAHHRLAVGEVHMSAYSHRNVCP